MNDGCIGLGEEVEDNGEGPWRGSFKMWLGGFKQDPNLETSRQRIKALCLQSGFKMWCICNSSNNFTLQYNITAPRRDFKAFYKHCIQVHFSNCTSILEKKMGDLLWCEGDVLFACSQQTIAAPVYIDYFSTNNRHIMHVTHVTRHYPIHNKSAILSIHSKQTPVYRTWNSAHKETRTAVIATWNYWNRANSTSIIISSNKFRANSSQKQIEKIYRSTWIAKSYRTLSRKYVTTFSQTALKELSNN